ncbi:lysine--tRNA ligase [Candidatus Microgenomates bacterium]|nr:lysine--tRNA ligase [Candidatus Microgenomates bacterium]
MSMFWADELLANVKGPQIINDSWTPSGMVHMGSLKGPVIHDTLFQILKERKQKVKFIYGFDDADPIDGLPADLQTSHGKYLGIPLYLAPAPSGKGSFADYFADKMKSLLSTLNIKPEIYKTSELYNNGTFNKAIQFVLDNADQVRRVYSNIYQKEIAKDWFPLQVVCPKCGKVGTTKVTGWNGKEVAFSCEETLVKWAKGCGFNEKISPFDGKSKMPWKVEWAAKWWTFGVTIEGAGKDHASAGGSYDVALKICREVFAKEPPLQFAYEFFLTGGKKMSSSKGLGLTGEELLEVLPPELVRFLMVKTKINQAVNFDPYEPTTIPRLFDEYDKENPSKKMRFSDVVNLLQMPGKEKELEREDVKARVPYAKIWLDKFAPEEEKFTVKEEFPEAALHLSALQKMFLAKVAGELMKNWQAEDFQANLYNWAKELEISSKEAFSAIYLSLIGKDHGPKAAWLILSLDRGFVKKRFSEI